MDAELCAIQKPRDIDLGRHRGEQHVPLGNEAELDVFVLH